jgi:bifunctional DNA-binding transcriptional regulator/antitoxin component of YhaV-PrlF toxin-antitoxin module
MELVKLGKKGQLTLPKAVLKRSGISADAPLLVETSGDGSIVLRQAAVYPVEIYTDARIGEFERNNRVPPALHKKVQTYLRRKKRR